MADNRTVEIPQSVLISAQSLDDLEDWLAAHDPDFLEEIRRIRNDEDLGGQGILQLAHGAGYEWLARQSS